VTRRPSTLYDKIWDSHLVVADDGGEALIYIDRHLLHEVSSPQAFEGLARRGLRLRRPALTLGVADHNVPTQAQGLGLAGVADPAARAQMQALSDNAARYGFDHYPMGDARNGIVHVVAPEQGLIHPGMTVVCGDSHTSTLGAFGALAHGIGTSEVEHVLATQTLRQAKARNMRIRIDGRLAQGVEAKDLALAVVRACAAQAGRGCVVEYQGKAVRRLSMEERMTLCNMTIEAGARAGLIAPDRTTLDYLRGRPQAPEGQAWDEAAARWSALTSDADAAFDVEVEIDAAAVAPTVTWGTRPDQSVAIDEPAPDPSAWPDPRAREAVLRALDYMAIRPGQALKGLAINKVFIGSCTNSRIEDLRRAAALVARAGGRVADGVRALVVPGSRQVMAMAEAEGLDAVFRAVGFEWREPGCSMCAGMNADRLDPGERCASTSNRNFEGRQGPGGRTHLMSPTMAAAAALAGRIVDAREV